MIRLNISVFALCTILYSILSINYQCYLSPFSWVYAYSLSCIAGTLPLTIIVLVTIPWELFRCNFTFRSFLYIVRPDCWNCSTCWPTWTTFCDGNPFCLSWICNIVSCKEHRHEVTQCCIWFNPERYCPGTFTKFNAFQLSTIRRTSVEI